MKQYVKPRLFFESYELNRSVAACRWDVNYANEDVCNAEYDTDMKGTHDLILKMFTDTPRCNVTPETTEEYCYTNGTDSYKLFQS